MMPRVVVGLPSSPRNLRSKWPTHLRTPQFWPVSAHNASTVRAGEKVQLTLIGSRPCAFQRAIDKPCTLPPSPPMSGTKCNFAVFASKIQLLSKKICYKVSLCENVRQQSCSYIISLSNTNSLQMDCWRRPKNLHWKWSTPSENADFYRFGLIVLQPWELAKKVQLSLIGSPFAISIEP